MTDQDPQDPNQPSPNAGNNSGQTIYIGGASPSNTTIFVPITSGSKNVIWSNGSWIAAPKCDPLPEPEQKTEAKSDGCNCRKCKEFYPFAEPNQDDGTLICYGCRVKW